MASRSPPQDEDSRSSSTDSPAAADNEESDFFLVTNDSQSSLGVVNFQDMQVDDVCWPPVHRLPNEILIGIFSKLSTPSDLLHSMLVCKRWTRNAVDLLWHRPACTSWSNHEVICQTVALEKPFFNYRDFIKRLNLAALSNDANDGSVLPLAVCTRVERLTLTNCRNLTDTGLIALVENNASLLALDVSNVSNITEQSIYTIAEHCKRLQGLNVSGCALVSNESMLALSENCRYIKRLKLNECAQLGDDVVHSFAENCPNILEIDLQHCTHVSNGPVTALFTKGRSLRELRLANCELVDDAAFLNLPVGQTYEHLRILDLTSCLRLTDVAVQKIITAAPRLRNLVLAKCRLITDVAVKAIAGLGKNLHYVHLGHCAQITDEGVKKLVHDCTRIRYIDLGCCINLTDESVKRLALLPKLKRIGLVKCNLITDASVLTLAEVAMRPRVRRDGNGMFFGGEYYSSCLERVHLSYCVNLTLKSIMKLLNSCPRLTHLSLTGVAAFQRDDFQPYCRPPPPEFTPHQRDVFCVFSGNMVSKFRDFLNTSPLFEEFREGAVNPRHLMRRGNAARQFNAQANSSATYDDIYEYENEDGDETPGNDGFAAGPTIPGAFPPPIQNHVHNPTQAPAPQMAHSLPIMPVASTSIGDGPSPPNSHFYAPVAMTSSFMTNESANGAPPLSAFGHTQASMAGGAQSPSNALAASTAHATSAGGASTAQMHQQPAEAQVDGVDEVL